jgi:o-succinylbenzoate synthase
MNELLNSSLPRVQQAELLLFNLPLVSPFETSFGSIDHREIIVCRLKADGITAYGECAADADPLYSSETNFTCWEIRSQST